MPPERPRAPGPSGAAAQAAIAWAALAAAHVVLSGTAPRGVLRDPLLSPGARLALLALELVAQALAVALLGALLWLPGRLRPRLAAAGGGLLGAVLLLGLAASWASFWFSGRFLDGEGAAFCAANFGPLCRLAARMHPAATYAGPPLLAAAAAGTAVALPRLAARLPGTVRKAVAGGGITLVAAAGLAALAGGRDYRAAREKVTDPDTGVVYSPAELFRRRRDQAAGPLIHLLAAPTGRRGDAEGRGLPEVPPPALVRRPILPMERYLAGVDEGRARPWNVVVILVDSLRADHLIAGGCPRDVMPAVNALARASRVFTDCVTQATHTDYAVPPVFCSHYPLRVRDAWRHPQLPTFPRLMIYDLLKRRGYRTALFSSQNENWGQMAGFLRTEGLDRYVFPGAEGGAGFADMIDDRITVSGALSWLEEARGTPFFLALNLQSAHVPYAIPADFPRRFGPRAVDFTLGAGHFPRERAGTVRDLYADALAYADAQVGRLLARLEGPDLRERTVVVVTGDHGESFYEHGAAAHANGLFEEVVRVPLLMRAPGLEPGTDARPAQLLDVAPTLCGLLGLPPHPSFQGLDLLGSSFPPERSRFVVSDTPWSFQAAVIRSGFKLIHDPEAGRCALYDLRRDPGERTDVSSVRPEVAADLAARLAAWRRAQREYYGNPLRHGLEYPPVLAEP